MKKLTFLFIVTALILGLNSTATALVLPKGSLLTIEPEGSPFSNGSYFTMTLGPEQVITTNIQSTRNNGEPTNPLSRDNGILIGIAQPAETGRYSGPPIGILPPTPTADTGPIDQPWSGFGYTGHHFTTNNGILDNGDGTLDFSGWRITWNGISEINMGGIQDCGTSTDGICIAADGRDIEGIFDNGTGTATITIVGDLYTLDYLASVPQADPSNFGAVPYGLHLEGRIFLDTDGDEISGLTDNCPNTYNPGQVDSDGDGMGNACDPYPDYPNNEAAQCYEELGLTISERDHALEALQDTDKDGVPDSLDVCAGTSLTKEVDRGGCSIIQFCSNFDANTRYGVRVCTSADWKNDEPVGNSDDCQVLRARKKRPRLCLPSGP